MKRIIFKLIVLQIALSGISVNLSLKKILVTSLSVLTVTFLCVFALAPIAQAQSSGGQWSGDEFCENPGGFNCLPEIVVE